MKWLIILLLSVLLVNCSNQEKEKYLLELKKMETVLDSIQAIDFDKLNDQSKEITDSVKSTIIKIKNNYQNDTISYSLVQDIESYKEIEKALKLNAGNLLKIKQTLPEAFQKNKDLEHDIRHSVNNRDKYSEYIDFEREKIGGIQSIANYYIQTIEEYSRRYDTLHPIITKFGKSLATENK